MGHDESIELAILKSIDLPYQVFGEDFKRIFNEISDDFEVIFRRLIVQPEPGCIKETNLPTVSRPGYYYEITKKGKHRINVLQKKWEKEVQEELAKAKEASWSLSRTNWTVRIGWGTIFILFFTILVLAGTIWLIVLEYRKPPETHTIVKPVPDTLKSKAH